MLFSDAVRHNPNSNYFLLLFMKWDTRHKLLFDKLTDCIYKFSIAFTFTL